MWALVAPLIPAHRNKKGHRPGRDPVPERAALTGILYVLRSGVPWQPPEALRVTLERTRAGPVAFGIRVPSLNHR